MQFLMQLAEQANEFCSAQNKKTVCPDHVLDALNVSIDNPIQLLLETHFWHLIMGINALNILSLTFWIY